MVAYWFALVLVPLLLVGVFNFTIDPLWCYSHSNFLNQRQPGFNERQQKTNRFYFTKPTSYDTLLLGSSRSGYISQYAFKNMKVFNYTADTMMTWEYNCWIDIAQSIKQKRFDNVIIGLDFFNTSLSLESQMKKKFGKPHNYFNKTRSSMYRYKTLLSSTTLKNSYKTIKRLFHPTISDYDRLNVRHAIRIFGEQKEKYVQSSINEYQDIMGKRYRYNVNLFKDLSQLKKNYPGTKFYIFTTPVSAVWFKKIILDKGRFEDYKKWLHNIVEIFGTVYHFMDLNSITTDLNNFFDAHHLYPEKAKYIAFKISDPENTKTPKDFGKILTKTTIERYISDLEYKIDKIKSE